MLPGIYRIYSRHLAGKPEQDGFRLISRFLVHDNSIMHLEDHDNQIGYLIPAGPVTERTENRFQDLIRNPYLKIIHEDDLKEGNHPEYISALNLGVSQPEAVFNLTYDGQVHNLEVYSGCAVLDGKTLNDDELKTLMLEIESKKKLLEPRG